MEHKELHLAARIGYISRFTGKPSEAFIKRYRPLMEQYVNYQKLADLLDPNSSASEYELIERARNTAGYEMDTGSRRKDGQVHLASVFSRVSSSNRSNERSCFAHYRYAELNPENAFPTGPNSENAGSLKKLQKSFYREMDQVMDNPPSSFESFMVVLDRLLKQYCWCISASDFEGEDVSLYDYMKITEALASCLVEASDEKNPYVLAAADFSGIQKYIFSISSANRKGVAKKLRSRSFMVDLISKTFSMALADEFGQGHASILLQTGGKFYIILPNTEDADERLEGIQKKFDHYLFTEFGGSVNVNMAWLTCSDRDLYEYSSTITKLNRELSQSKMRPFSSVLISDGQWNTEKFVLTHDLADKKMCPGCGQQLVPSNQDECRSCRLYSSIGTQLPRTRYIAFFRNPVESGIVLFGGYSILLLDSLIDWRVNDACLIESLHGDLPVNSADLPLTVHYMANHIPADSEGPLTFQNIAESSQGWDRLGVLKADVDGLGFVFAQGLRTPQRHYGTISRVNTMSRMLEVFFSGYIQQLISSNEDFRNIYSVYSGGDDLFLLGPWDSILKLACRISEDFGHFAADNPDITLSAGISIADSHKHISTIAVNTEEYLEKAKTDIDLRLLPPVGPKNCVNVTGRLLAWPELKRQLTVAEKLAGLAENGELSVSILRRLIRYAEDYQNYQDTGDPKYMMGAAHMNYDVRRNYPDQESKKEYSADLLWFLNSYIPNIKDSFQQSGSTDLIYLDFAVEVALNLTKKKRRDS